MKLKFKQQGYQTDAVKAVVACFAGQPKSRGSKYVVEDGKVRLPFCSLKGLGGAAADALENATLHGQEYLSIEELQQASGVGSSIIDRLRQVGALGDLPESSQVSFF